MNLTVLKIALMAVLIVSILFIYAEERPRGRDIVRIGEYKDFAGVVFLQKGEWFLRSDKGLFEIHFGDKDYQERIEFKMEEGTSVKVKGFLYENDIAVVSISFNDKTFNFRDEKGSPLWAGEGGRRNVNPKTD